MDINSNDDTNPDRRIIGYARVSTKDQNLNRQLDQLREYGVTDDNIYADEASGANFNRDAYKEMLASLQQGDLIIITSIDRLGRNYDEILNQWRLITKEIQADIKVLDQPILDATIGKDVMGTFVSDLILQVLSFQSETERTHIKQRQREGIEAARKRGQSLGRPRKPMPENFNILYQRFKDGESVRSLATECDLSETTLRKRLYEQFDLEVKQRKNKKN